MALIAVLRESRASTALSALLATGPRQPAQQP
jgi:hypothetical protein